MVASTSANTKREISAEAGRVDSAMKMANYHDLSDFHRCIIVGAREIGHSHSEGDEFSCMTILRVCH